MLNLAEAREVKHFRCQQCDAPLGETDGRELHVGNIILFRCVTLRCAACGVQRIWRPVLQVEMAASL